VHDCVPDLVISIYVSYMTYIMFAPTLNILLIYKFGSVLYQFKCRFSALK